MRWSAPLLLAAGLAAASATAFDGTRYDGELAVPAPGAIAIGGRVLALADLDELVLGDGPAPRAAPMELHLADGGRLPLDGLGAAPAADHLLAATPLGALALPLDAVAAWGPAPPPPGGDDAIVLDSGVLRGRVQGLDGAGLRFLAALDPEPLIVPLSSIRSARLAVRRVAAAAVRLRAGAEGGGTGFDVLLTPAGPVLAAAPSAAIDAAALGGLRLRVEGPRRTYLSDLVPVRVEESGAFGVVWPHARDAAIGGGPLRLGGRTWAKGLTVHSAARLVWRLDGAFLRLRAQAGIADTLAPEGDCLATLVGDGRELWRGRLRGGSPPLVIDLDLAGIAELSFAVAQGERHDIGDHAVLADAQLIRRAAAGP